ncbi:MAG: YeeE/YedE thiosulfate transporter family protein, partial [Dehalococcoidia bacterium]
MTTTLSAATPLPLKQRAVALAALVALLGGALILGQQGWRYGALLTIGVLLGMSLYHAAFGFTSAYRNALLHRDVTGVVAQLIMLGLAMLLFAPVLARGEAFGHGIVGAVAPASLQVAIGSFLFGLGMQLGGGCGSGTLYTVGGGSARMVVTLIAFCAGAFAGSLDMARYAGLPGLGTVSLAAQFGFGGAILLQLSVLVALWLGLRLWSRGTT